jgi:HK97 family phage major capsid protein
MPEPTQVKALLDGITSSIATVVKEVKDLRAQTDEIDLRTKAGSHISNYSAPSPLVEKLKESEAFERLLHDRRGSAILTLSGKDAESVLQRKTTMTEVGQGFQTTGVMPIERDPGITAEARQQLTVRDALTARPTEASVIDYVKVSTPLSIASPAPEASTKAENQLQFTSASERIKVIATWIPASKQLLDDYGELANFLETSLGYYVSLEEELQLLAGDGTGENVHGLIPQASGFDTSLLTGSGNTNIDQIGAAIEQLTIAKEIAPSFAILHPRDWWQIRRLKDTLGRYLIGDPSQSGVRANLFDLLVIPTTSITQGTFLVGSGNPAAAEIRDRTEVMFEVSTSHASFFTQNLLACRAERRLALVVKRAASYVTGTFA